MEGIRFRTELDCKRPGISKSRLGCLLGEELLLGAVNMFIRDTVGDAMRDTCCPTISVSNLMVLSRIHGPLFLFSMPRNSLDTGCNCYISPSVQWFLAFFFFF